jgi:hypothetical protein
MLGGEPQNALTNRYSKVPSRSHHAVIRVYGEAADVIETHEHKRAVQTSGTLTSARRLNASWWFINHLIFGAMLLFTPILARAFGGEQARSAATVVAR